MKRSLAAIALSLAASLSLTACDPPMPPEVLATLAEQTYTCEAGDSPMHALPAVAAVATDWQFSVEMNCPGMTITPTTELTENTPLQIHDANASAVGKAFSSVPFALDALVLAVYLPDITNVNLSAELVRDIWAGKVSNWNAPEIAELNAGFELPDLPIQFGTDPSLTNIDPFLSWMQRLTGDTFELSGGTANLEDFAEGSLILMSYSKASEAGDTLVGIYTDKAGEGIVPVTETLSAAATMFDAKFDSGTVVLTFDPEAIPLAPEGINQVPNPYEAVTFITLSLIGEDNLATRAAAKYLLRQDSQGSLGLSYVVAIPEKLRAIALAEVSIGLPQPTIAPE